MHLSTILLAALDSQAAPLPIYTGLGAVQCLETFKGSVNRSLAQLTVHVCDHTCYRSIIKRHESSHSDDFMILLLIAARLAIPCDAEHCY